MVQITSTLKRKIAQITTDIEKLQAQREALEMALSSFEGQTERPTRRRAAAAARRTTKRRGGPRAKRGANQETVLSLLGRNPRRLGDIASHAKLTMTAAGSVLRALIAKGVVTKGDKRGTYLLKVRPAKPGAAKPGTAKAGTAKTKVAKAKVAAPAA
jgi:hypothetical protein